jgi:hypothetical protein
MACDIYSGEGAIPEDLTVTRLYTAYWDRRIERDRRAHRSRRARLKLGAAEALAAAVWDASGARFAEFVPPGPELPDEGVNDLLSEGIVKVVGGRYAFFHQTYAEFAVGRHLVVQGSEADLLRLRDGLRGGLPGYWAVARHALLMQTDPQRLAVLAAHVPLETVEGVRIHFQSAFTHDDPQRVEWLAETVRESHPDLLITASSILESAPPSCVAAALEAGLWALATADRAKFAKVAVTVAGLIRATSTPAARTAALERALDLVLSKSAEHGKTDSISVLRRLLEQTRTADVDLLMLIGKYDQLPEPVRGELIRIVRSAGAGRLVEVELTVQALGAVSPLSAADDLAAILARTWLDPDVRAVTGWSDWQSMLESGLPERWDACQVRLIRQLSAHAATARAVLEVAFSSGTVQHRDRYTNAAHYIATDHPQLVARTIIESRRERSSAVVGSFAAVSIPIAVELDAATRLELAQALRRDVAQYPRKLWPAIIKLCSYDVGLLRDCLAELTRFAAEEAPGLMDGTTVVRKAFDTVLHSASSAVVRELAPELELLCATSAPEDRERYARLQGRLTPVSAQAREWVRNLLLTDDRSKVAAGAAGAVADSLGDWAEVDLQSTGLHWLLILIRSPHARSVQLLANGIVSHAEELQFGPEWAIEIVERLISSLERGENAHTQKALIELLAALDRSVGIPAGLAGRVVEAYFAAVAARLRTHGGAGDRTLQALFPLLTDVISSVGLRSLDVDASDALVSRVLTTLDSGAVAEHARRSLASMLVGVVRRHPALLARLEELWVQSPDANKAAIADCIAVVEVGTQGIRSLRLARRADCPPKVASFLHSRFDRF